MTSSADTVPLCKRLHRGKRDREGRAWQSKGMGGDRREKRIFFQTGGPLFQYGKENQFRYFPAAQASVKAVLLVAKSN